MTKTDPKGKIYIFQYFLLKISELLSEINTNIIFFAKIAKAKKNFRPPKILTKFFLGSQGAKKFFFPFFFVLVWNVSKKFFGRFRWKKSVKKGVPQGSTENLIARKRPKILKNKKFRTSVIAVRNFLKKEHQDRKNDGRATRCILSV